MNSLIDNYLANAHWRVKENSNANFSVQGLNHNLSNYIIKKYWLDLYPKDVKNAYESGLMHIHDIGHLSSYCGGWDLYQMLHNGFGGVDIKVESDPPKHFSSALDQLSNYLFTLQSEQAGAQAVSSFDTLLAPYIYYDKLTYKEVKQCLQEFIYCLNISLRSGFQTTFSNITLDLKPSKIYRDSPVTIANETKDKTYGEFQHEMNMINDAFCEVMTEGDKNGKIFSFPIPTYNITEDFDWESDDYRKLWEMTAKYGVPYFANFIHSNLDPNDVRSMCCRLRLDTRKLHRSAGGLFGANPLTGSIGVVTINLPRLAYISRMDTPDSQHPNYEQNILNKFYELLDQTLELAKTSLEIKRKAIDKFTYDGLYPYIKAILEPIYERTGSYWSNHFSTIGIIGANEACLNLFGCNIINPKGKQFTEDILNRILDRITEFQKITKNLYNLEATPAESTCYRLACKDKKDYPDIITAGTIDVPYYTNSTHMPVTDTIDIFDTLKHQESLQTKYTGGTVVHLFLSDNINDWKQARLLVKTICENFAIPYITLTPTFSICSNHGYLSGKQVQCPYSCKERPLIYSRIVGFHRPIDTWNNGKQQEFKERKTYQSS